MSEESTTSDSDDSDKAPEAKPSGLRRIINIIAAIIVAVVLPVLVVGALIGHFAASAMFIGLLWGGLGAKLGGTRRMMYLAPAVGLAAGLASGTAYGWWWVALLGVLGVVAGSGIGFGWFAPLLMLPFAATFVTPEASTENAVIYGVVAGIGTLYGVVLARRFGAAEVVEGERQPRQTAILVSIVLGVALAGAAAIGVGLGWSEPYWVPEPILILTLYVLLGKRERIEEKAIGTALGASAAVVVAIIAPPPEVIGVIATVAFVLALTQLKTYWLYYGLYTFALVLALAAPAKVGVEAKERGVEILVGIGLLVVGLAIVHAVAARLSESDPEPELAPA